MPLSEMLNTGVYAVFIGVGALGLLLGLSRGYSRQTVKMVTVIAAFLISLALFKRAYPYMISVFEEKTLYEVTQMLGITFKENVTNYLKVIEGEDAAYIMAVPLTVVIMPIFFLLCMGLIAGILTFPYIVVCGALGFTKKANGPISRLLGGAIGALQGMFIAALIIMPVAGMVDIANEAVTIAETEHPNFKNTEKISKLYNENIGKVSENTILKKVDNTFGFIYDGFTTIDIEGDEVHVVTAVDDMVELYVYYGELGGGKPGDKFDYKNPSPKDREIIDLMIESFGDDRLMTVLVADAFKAFGTSSETGAFILKIDEPMKTLMTALIKTFATTDEDNVENDLYTFADVYYLLATEGVFKSSDTNEIFTKFLNTDENGNSAFKRLCVLLEGNPRYAHMSPTLSTVAMDMLLQNSGVDKDTVETLEEVKDTVNDVLLIEKDNFETEEEYKEAVNTEVNKTLEDNGIQLAPEELDQLTDYIIQQKEEGKTEFTDADMADFMAKYYDIYANGGTIGGGTDDDGTDGGDTDGGDTEGEGGGIVLPPDFELPPGFEFPES